MRAGTETMVRRRVAVVAFVSLGSQGEGAGGAGEVERLHRADQPGGFAENEFDGKCARAEFVRSACTCSITACLPVDCVGATVSRSSGSGVVKNAWNRQMSNNVP